MDYSFQQEFTLFYLLEVKNILRPNTISDRMVALGMSLQRVDNLDYDAWCAHRMTCITVIFVGLFVVLTFSTLLCTTYGYFRD